MTSDELKLGERVFFTDGPYTGLSGTITRIYQIANARNAKIVHIKLTGGKVVAEVPGYMEYQQGRKTYGRRRGDD